MREPIIVVPYRPEWPVQFEELRRSLSAALAGVVSQIEHVGSTAVPNLAAKPIIDIDAIIDCESDFPEVRRRLEHVGYEYVGDCGVPGREAFNHPRSAEITRHHLYVCCANSRELRRHIVFRDYLRRHPESALAYGQLKFALAQRFRDDGGSYVEAKTEFIESALSVASAAR